MYPKYINMWRLETGDCWRYWRLLGRREEASLFVVSFSLVLAMTMEIRRCSLSPASTTLNTKRHNPQKVVLKFWIFALFSDPRSVVLLARSPLSLALSFSFS
jgi:hypothetical protein